ncbi:hypothetical protein FJ251_00930 [bacterium]|nr:hypothetical protein [bacterium]
MRFQIWTADSLALVGGYLRTPSGAQPRPIALLLHDRGVAGGSLASLGGTFQALGVEVLLPDLRGEGQSRVSVAGPVPPAPRWDGPARALLARDLEALFAFVDQQPGLAGRPWLLAAEGEATALALELLAGPRGGRFAGALLLSPLAPADLDSQAARAPQPVLLAVCDQDAESLAAARALAAAQPGPARRLERLDCRSRGAWLLAARPALPAEFLRWLAGEQP